MVLETHVKLGARAHSSKNDVIGFGANSSQSDEKRVELFPLHQT
jgi:hypothetical protein